MTYQEAVQDPDLYAHWLVQIQQEDAEDLAGRVGQTMTGVGMSLLPAFVCGLALQTRVDLADFVAANGMYYAKEEAGGDMAWQAWCANRWQAEMHPSETVAERNVEMGRL